MTKDEVIEMAHQAGFGGYASEAQSMFMEFAALVAEKEREACAKLVIDILDTCIANDVDDPSLRHVAEAILARKQ